MPINNGDAKYLRNSKINGNMNETLQRYTQNRYRICPYLENSRENTQVQLYKPYNILFSLHNDSNLQMNFRKKENNLLSCSKTQTLVIGTRSVTVE